jgi:hypothetical protein
MLETTVDMRIFEHFSSAWPDSWQTERIGRKPTLFLYALSGFGVARYF